MRTAECLEWIIYKTPGFAPYRSAMYGSEGVNVKCQCHCSQAQFKRENLSAEKHSDFALLPDPQKLQLPLFS